MFLNVAIYTGLFLASGVLAVPSELGAHLARRREGHQSQLNHRLESDASAGSNVVKQENWAGAVWAEAEGTFTTITGTFSVPTLSASPDASTSAAAWVGIDGSNTCGNGYGSLQTGVGFTVSPDGESTYNAWYEWLPAAAQDFSGITVSAGDIIKLTVEAHSTTSGTVTIENQTSGQTTSEDLTSSSPLCQENAEWIVEDYTYENELAPFANFGNVTFTDAEAGTYTPSGATIYEIEQDGKDLTSVSTSGSSVTIMYV